MNNKFPVPIPGKRKTLYYTVTRRTLTPQTYERLPKLFPGIDQVPPILNIYRILHFQRYILENGDGAFEKSPIIIIPKHISQEEKLIQIIYACSGLLSRKTLRWTYPPDMNLKEFELLPYLWTLLTYKEETIIRESLKKELYKLLKVKYRKNSNLKNNEFLHIRGNVRYKLKCPLETSLDTLRTKVKEERHDILDRDWSSQTGGIPDTVRKDIFRTMLSITEKYLVTEVKGQYDIIMMVNGGKGWKGLNEDDKRECKAQYKSYKIDPYSGIMQKISSSSSSITTTPPSSFISSSAASSSEEELHCKR